MTAQEAIIKTEEKAIILHNTQYNKIIAEITAVVNDVSTYAREVYIYGFTLMPSVKNALEKDGYTVHPAINDFKDGIMTRIEW